MTKLTWQRDFTKWSIYRKITQSIYDSIIIMKRLLRLFCMITLRAFYVTIPPTWLFYVHSTCSFYLAILRAFYANILHSFYLTIVRVFDLTRLTYQQSYVLMHVLSCIMPNPFCIIWCLVKYSPEKRLKMREIQISAFNNIHYFKLSSKNSNKFKKKVSFWKEFFWSKKKKNNNK